MFITAVKKNPPGGDLFLVYLCDTGHIRVEERAPEEGNADTEAPDQDSSLAAGAGGH